MIGNEKTETLTARVKKQTLEKLRSYAKTENTTLNSAINQLLSHAVDWDVAASKTGWIPIPKDILVSYFDRLDEKTIIEVADTSGKNVPRDLLLAMRGKHDIREWISVLRSRAKAAGFHYSEMIEDDHIKFVMKHDMGIKWSTYFQSYYDSAFRVLGCELEFSITHNTISYKISRKDYEPEQE
jgi:hypothetical protein